MNFGSLFKAFDAVMAFRDAARRFKGESPPPDTALSQQPAAHGLAGQLEATLTNVVVAALKEAFDRDHARLELERAQLEEQRRRADEALRLELRRQAVDRELGRLRLLAGTAMVGWIASMLMIGLRVATLSTPSRLALAVGWLCLLGALAAAFIAQGRLRLAASDDPGADPVATASLWLLMAGLAGTAISLLL